MSISLMKLDLTFYFQREGFRLTKGECVAYTDIGVSKSFP